MKRILFSLCSMLWFMSADSTIYRVGYSGFSLAGTDFAYTDLQSAINAASNNDTIQIYQQSATQPNSASVTKPLRIIGFGHTLNVNSGLQVVNKPDSINNSTYLDFDPGSEGSMVEGLNLNYLYIDVSNITVTRCRFRQGMYDDGFVPCGGGGNLFTNHTATFAIQIFVGVNGADANNITISDCFFDGWNQGANIQVNNYNSANKCQNLIINNNYFQDQLNLKTNIAGQVSGIFANNIMNFKYRKLANTYNYNNNVCTEGYFSGCDAYMNNTQFDQFLIKNNIFNTADTVTWPILAQNSIVQNNLFSCASQYAGYTAGGSNNVFKANMSNVFGPLWNNGLVYNDNQLALGSSSPAINAGLKYNNTATNCGVFGGETDQDYKLSGIPNVPAFYQLSAPNVNATSSPYNITTSVRSNK